MFLTYNLLDDNISLNELPYFVESIVYCLSDVRLRVLGDELLRKLYLNHDAESLRRAFESELTHSSHFYNIFLQWHKEHSSLLAQ
jgi:hypothetical protein